MMTRTATPPSPTGRNARPNFLLTAAVAGLSFVLAAATSAARPNIVLVITDDQGYGDVGHHGNTVIQTPAIDALAKESVALDDYHVAPTCSPTRAALLTGHWTNRTGVWHTIMGRSMLRANEVTLGQLFKDAGYQTGMFGKWHLGDNHPYRPEDRGFTEVYRHGGGGVGQTPDVWNNSYFDGGYFHNGALVPAKGFCTDVFFERANAFIRSCAAKKEPFLAYISTNAPHGPLHAPQKYLDLYADQPKNLAAFFGMITNIDDNVAQTRALLKELGLHENTIFIFTTDNGTASGEKVFNAGMRGKKGSEYDGGHRVPFFLHWPAGGMAKGRVIDRLAHAVDVVPTLLDLAGIVLPDAPGRPRFDGVSLRPLLDPKSKVQWPDRLLVTDSQRVVDPIKWRKSAVMSERWRLVNGVELYEIDKDPGQRSNVANQHPIQVKLMRDFYEAWWAELEPTFSRTTEIYIGQPGVETGTLTAHDWIGKSGTPWNQRHIRDATGYGQRPRRNQRAPAAGNPGRQARKHTSHWAVKVITPGTYKIEVSRWPPEANSPITAALPAGADVPGASRAFRAAPGRAIVATAATLRIDGEDIQTKPVPDAATEVTFTAELTAGSHRLSPVFLTDKGEVGAYYAVVTKVE